MIDDGIMPIKTSHFSMLPGEKENGTKDKIKGASSFCSRRRQQW
jgi:hypothetical protein